MNKFLLPILSILPFKNVLVQCQQNDWIKKKFNKIDPQIFKQYQNSIDELQVKMENISALSPENQWKENVKGPEFKSHYKLDDKLGLVYARGEGTIPASIQDCCSVIFNVEKRLLYDQQVIDAKMLEVYSEDLGLMYTKMKGQLIMADRDFLFINGIKRINSKIYVLSTSVENPIAPVYQKIVRAHLHIGGWILTPITENQTHAIHVTCADPKSGVPTYLKLKKAQKRAEIVVWIADMFKKQQQIK